MEIIWHGDTCFTVKEKSVSVVINPNSEAGKLKANIVLSSRDDSSKIEGVDKVIDWPGEYEVKGVPITAISASNTLIFYFHVDGVKFCHLGDLDSVPSSEVFQEIGDIDVLMIKIGEGSSIDSKKAMEIIENIEPKVLIPMGADFEAALKGIGADKVETQDKFEIKSGGSDLPVDHMKYVVLNRV